MPKNAVTAQKIHDHVERLGELYPPIPLSSVDRTIRDPELLRPLESRGIDVGTTLRVSAQHPLVVSVAGDSIDLTDDAGASIWVTA